MNSQTPSSASDPEDNLPVAATTPMEWPRTSEFYKQDMAWVQERFPRAGDESKFEWAIRCRRNWEDIKALEKAEWDRWVAEQVELTLGDLDHVERPRTPKRDFTYYVKALQGMLVDMASAPGGTRNDTLNATAYRLGRITSGLGMQKYGLKALEELRKAARKAGLPEREIQTASWSGYRKGLEKPWRPA